MFYISSYLYFKFELVNCQQQWVAQKKWSSTIEDHSITIRLITSYYAYTDYIYNKLRTRLLYYRNKLSLL